MMGIFRKIRHIFLIYFKWRRYSFGRNPYIGRSVYMWAKTSIVIGDDFYIGKYSQIECDAVIGNDVMFANYVALIGRHDHNYSLIGTPMRHSSSIRDRNYNWKGLNEKVVIEDDVWVGHGAIILSGVTVRQGSIIAAGSVVTCDVEPCSIYGGNPARKIKDRFVTEEEKAEHIRLYFLRSSGGKKNKRNYPNL